MTYAGVFGWPEKSIRVISDITINMVFLFIRLFVVYEFAPLKNERKSAYLFQKAHTSKCLM